MNLLEAVGVEATHGDRRVVNGVDLRVGPGELWAILGPNGAGKSTLVRTLLGLHPLGAGSVTLLGRALGAWRRADLAREVAWVPQVFEPGSGFTGLELVAMGRAPHQGLWGLPSDSDLAGARNALAELGVSHLADRPSHAMSGGEQRLLLLARAFVQSPRLLMLDEPTAFLDLRHQVEALRTLRARTRSGLSAVAVLHDVNLAAAWADHVALVREGRILASGPTAEVLTGERLEELYGVPMAHLVAEGGQPIFAPRMAT
jgi:iron complex transport system ATP-binding protein